MKILGYILALVGVALSAASLIHDVRRHQISREHGGQAAPSRIAPEVHALAALFLGAGIGLVAGWRMGAGSGVVYAVVIYAALYPWINR